MDASENLKNLLKSPAYRLAFEDIDFLKHDALRPVRLQLELQKPEMVMDENNIHSTVVVFGSARLVSKRQAEEKIAKYEEALATDPENGTIRSALKKASRQKENAKYYEEARKFSHLVSTSCQVDGKSDFVIVTGGGPGIMEAANLGAFEAKAKSVGLNITLPHEQFPNSFITPELCFQFQYFAIRKMHFLLRAKALVVFPGGFGTLDELFEALTLMQTKRMPVIPTLLFGEKYWKKAVNLEFLVEQGTINERDLDLFKYVETAEQAWTEIVDFYAVRDQWPFQADQKNGKFLLYGNNVERI